MEQKTLEYEGSLCKEELILKVDSYRCKNRLFIAMVKKSRQFAALSLLLVVCLDIALETYPIANTRTAIIKENYETSLYNDGTKEAAADIQSKDLGLYRITMHFPMTVTIS